VSEALNTPCPMCGEMQFWTQLVDKTYAYRCHICDAKMCDYCRKFEEQHQHQHFVNTKQAEEITLLKARNEKLETQNTLLVGINQNFKARNAKLERVRLEASKVSILILLDNTADTAELDKAIKDCEVGDALFD